MDWRNESVWELRHLEAKRASIDDIRESIRVLERQMTALRSATSDATPVSGGGSSREDMLLSWITEKDSLQATLAVDEMQVDMIERALGAMTKDDREILDLCYIHEKVGNINKLCEVLGCDTSTVYRKRNRAIRAYTIRRRGLDSI